MAWRAILEQIVEDGGRLVAALILTDDTRKEPFSLPLAGLSIENFKARIQAELDKFNVADQTQLILKLFPPGSVIDTTPVPPFQSEEDLARIAYGKALVSVVRANQGVNLGVWDAGDKEVVDRITTARNLRRAEYLD